MVAFLVAKIVKNVNTIASLRSQISSLCSATCTVSHRMLSGQLYTLRVAHSITSCLRYDTDQLRFAYTSPFTPECTYDYDMTRRELILLRNLALKGKFWCHAYTSLIYYTFQLSFKVAPLPYGISLKFRVVLKKIGQNSTVQVDRGYLRGSLVAGG